MAIFCDRKLLNYKNLTVCDIKSAFLSLIFLQIKSLIIAHIYHQKAIIYTDNHPFGRPDRLFTNKSIAH